ncbi:MAG: TldD/PmbA family protein [bacterium]
MREDELKSVAQEVLGKVKEECEAELLLTGGEGALTRFGESRITQNVAQSSQSLSVRLIRDKKVGKASTGDLSPQGIDHCLARAYKAMEVATPDPDLLPLPEPQVYQAKESFYPHTKDYPPEERAQQVVNAVKRLQSVNLEGAGIFSTGGGALALANSKGLWAYHRRTNATFSLSAMSPDSSGWAQETDPDVRKIDFPRVIETATQKALLSREPRTVDPGNWMVIFEPEAVADFVLFLAWQGFNGKAFVEGRSPFSGKVGQRILGENITIVDDAYHPLSPGNPFDYEGMPRQRVVLVDRGVFLTTVHDRRTALKAGVESTGHALPQPDTHGPIPLNLVIEGGDSSLEEMIASTERGLLITRLHYTNLLDPMRLTITGMTRDGLFLVENGKVVGGVKNMRFTASVLDILNNVELLSRQLYKTETFWGGGGTVAPAMKVRDFPFTSVTEK